MGEGRKPAPARRGRRVARSLLLLALVATSGCIVEATWTQRAVEPVVAPRADRVMLTDVACPAEGACVAVGSLMTMPGTGWTVVLRQDGAGWEHVDVPHQVPGAAGVSCVGVDDCVVLGDVDLRYRDGELSIMPPGPLRPELVSFAALDCVPGAGCMRTDGESSSWWDGTAWSAPVALPAEMAPFDPQLSCTSPASCLLVATGQGAEGWPTPAQVTSTTWDGTAWSPVVALDHETRVHDLDCATATACIATAGIRAGVWAEYWREYFGPAPAEVLRWDGTTWTEEAIAYPGGDLPDEPGAVACTSATSCTVLSAAVPGTPPNPTVVVTWDGTAWTAATTNAAGPATALACTSPTSCTSAGDDVAQRWDGTAWSDTALPAGTSPAEQLTALSCPTADACVGVGAGWGPWTPVEGSPPQLMPTVQRFDGDAWTAEDAGGAALQHVSCATASSCMVAGSVDERFWSRHHDGTTWRPLPEVAGPGVGGVTGLSCATATWCLLLTADHAGGDRSWVWSGGDAWVEHVPLPGDGTTAGVSCPQPGECVAVSNHLGPQAFRLAGGAWSPLGLPELPGGVTLAGVDCAAPAECAVVGYATTADYKPMGVLAASSGGAWTVAERPGGSARDVDCWSPDGCVAVMTGAAPRLESWDGTAWRRVENPPGTVAVTAVACGAPARCEVAGAFVDGPERAAAATVVLQP